MLIINDFLTLYLQEKYKDCYELILFSTEKRPILYRPCILLHFFTFYLLNFNNFKIM
jgi:hypothetical protein